MPVPIILQMSEVADRYTICKLKAAKLPEGSKADFSMQAEHFREGIDFALPGISGILEDLYDVNESIWNVEGAIRRGEEADMSLEEVGRLALQVRDLNRARCTIKNQITTLAGGFRDCKVNYASGNP